MPTQADYQSDGEAIIGEVWIPPNYRRAKKTLRAFAMLFAMICVGALIAWIVLDDTVLNFLYDTWDSAWTRFENNRPRGLLS